MNQHRPHQAFERDVIEGLTQSPKTLPCKYLYDARGSQLFEEICVLPGYYPTRTELGILRRYGADIAESIGSGVDLIELGSGASTKTHLLLQSATAVRHYVPVEISADALQQSVARLREAFPDLSVRPINADYTARFEDELPEGSRRVLFFPGSTIGNYAPVHAVPFLRRIGQVVGPHGKLLIGVDLKKDPALLHRAYNDPEGITSAFNKNILERIRRELRSDIDPTGFVHYAPYNPILGRVEMHLVSLRAQVVTVGNTPVRFSDGETIHTENSYKYSLEEFEDLAARGGFARERVWIDPDRWFSVQLFTRED